MIGNGGRKMRIRLEVENKTGIKNEAAKDVKLPFREIEEATGIPGFKFSDIDAVHVGEHAIAIIEHTMTAHIENWGEAEWKSKCFKYFKMFEYSSKPAYIICTTNFRDHRDTKVIPYDDMHVCFVFKISLNDKIEDIKDIKKQFYISDSLGYILKNLFTN